jgi:hypothetical protein
LLVLWWSFVCFLYFKTENRYVYSIVLVWYQEKSCPSVEGLDEKKSRVRDLCQYLSVLQSLYNVQWSAPTVQHSCLPCHQKEKAVLKSHLLRRKSNEWLTSIEFHRGITITQHWA